MPWTDSQVRLFAAAAHNPRIAAKHGMTQSAARKMQVHPGEIGEANFLVTNLSDHTIVGQAVPSVTPSRAAVHFSKTECFCFTLQTLASGESQEMPVRFIVAPELPAGISTVTLSYTFFEVPGTSNGS